MLSLDLDSGHAKYNHNLQSPNLLSTLLHTCKSQIVYRLIIRDVIRFYMKLQ